MYGRINKLYQLQKKSLCNQDVPLTPKLYHLPVLPRSSACLWQSTHYSCAGVHSDHHAQTTAWQSTCGTKPAGINTLTFR